MAKTGRSSDQFMLRLPEDLRDRIRSIAERNGRSMNAEIVLRLERSISFEDEYGSIENAFKEVWGDIDEIKDALEKLSDKMEGSRDLFDPNQGSLFKR